MVVGLNRRGGRQERAGSPGICSLPWRFRKSEYAVMNFCACKEQSALAPYSYRAHKQSQLPIFSTCEAETTAKQRNVGALVFGPGKVPLTSTSRTVTPGMIADMWPCICTQAVVLLGEVAAKRRVAALAFLSSMNVEVSTGPQKFSAGWQTAPRLHP